MLFFPSLSLDDWRTIKIFHPQLIPIHFPLPTFFWRARQALPVHKSPKKIVKQIVMLVGQQDGQKGSSYNWDYNPYKWHCRWVCLGLFHPTYRDYLIPFKTGSETPILKAISLVVSPLPWNPKATDAVPPSLASGLEILLRAVGTRSLEIQQVYRLLLQKQ